MFTGVLLYKKAKTPLRKECVMSVYHMNINSL